MKKTKKAIASLAIASMILATVPFNAFAVNTVPTRLAGNTAAQTAVAIADQTGWTGTAILASSTSYGMVDALTAGPLASYLKAPILLTGAESTLDAATKAELVKLNVTKVYVTSGTAVIKQSVLDELVAMGITVTPLGGVDRAATSVNIASKMVGVTKVAVANGLQDALSIAAIASAANEPILLTDKAALPASVAAFLTANPSITSSDVIGGTGIISDAVKAALPSATRHAGVTAYDTNNQLIQDFASSLMFDNVYVANGVTGIDALAGAPLAAQTKSAIVLTDGTVPAAATFVHGKLAAGAVVTALGGAAVVPASVLTGVTTGVVTPPTGTLSVTSVSASSAKSFKVVFNQAPVDTAKVAFAVKGSSGTAVTTTATWNTAKTEATVSTSYNLTADSYAVGVKNGDTDLGTSTVAITQQAVKTITITSTVLSVAPITYVAGTSTETATSGEGFATYKVVDQYGVDITNTPLGNNIQWTCGIGTVDSTITKNGLIGIQKQGGATGIPLTQYTTASINGYDSNNYVTVSANLPISQGTGVISSITLNKLTSPNNDDFNAGNTTGQWYADYSALDASGNATTDYNLMKAGILTLNGGAFLKVEIVKDPADNAKAAISVTIDSTYSSSLAADTQVPITILTSGGKSSSLNVTLKKATSVNTFNVSAPTQMVASGETVILPFSALDQAGVAVKNYSDFFDASGNKKVNLTISGGGVIDLVRNADGTASVQATMPALVSSTGTLTVYIQSNVVSTGKSSQLTLNVQQPVKPDSIAIDNSIVVPFMQNGSSQKFDFGATWGGIAVNDQYGRAIDMTNESQVGDYYYVKPTVTSGTGNLTAVGNTYGSKTTTLSAIGVGSATVNYEVYKHNTVITAAHPAITEDYTGISKSVSYTVVKDSDIVNFAIDEITQPLKMLSTAAIDAAAAADVNGGTAVGMRDTEYAANPYIWGKTAGGAKVVLAGAKVAAVSIDGTHFALENQAAAGAAVNILNGATAQFNQIMIYAKELAASSNDTSASTNLTATIVDSTGNYRNVTTVIKSTTDSSVVSKIGFLASNASGMTGMSTKGNTVTVDAAHRASTFANLNGKNLTRYNNDGSTLGRAAVYFRAYDQFGTKAAPISLVSVTGSHFTNAGQSVSVVYNGSNDPVLTFAIAAVDAGDYVILSAIAANGQIQTVKILFE